MKTRSLRQFALLLVIVPGLWRAAPAAADLRDAVPAEVYVAVYGKHNPERDYQRKYYDEIRQAFEQTKILEKVLQIVTKRMSADDLDTANAVIKELQEAAAPIDFEALSQVKELVYAQRMPGHQSQHLLLMRVTPEAAKSAHQGVTNLFNLAAKHAGDALAVVHETNGDARLTTLRLQQQVQEIDFEPTVAYSGDLLMLGTTADFIGASLETLADGQANSKFDDPRVIQALQRLPAAEDAISVFDGQRLFADLKRLGPTIRRMSNNDPGASRAADTIELVLDELAIFDYEVTVEYTEGNLNHSQAYGKLLPNIEDKALAAALRSGQPFENWTGWVPSTALSYSLSTGVSLHPLYQRAIEVVNERFPEARPALEQFERAQQQLDVHLDRDILQSFSGESVSVSLPKAVPTLFGGTDSVTAMRCHNPDRIRELLHRLFAELEKNPALQAQGIRLTEAPDLEGFDQLTAPMMMSFGVRPVIGFREGWMIFATSPQAVQKVLDTRAGKGDTVTDTDAFKRFKVEVEGPVAAIGYQNLAQQTRAAAQMLTQAGAIAPMIIGMAGQEAPPEAVELLQEVVALLPDVGRIVRKFDFLEAKLSFTQAGEAGAYRRHSVTVVRPPVAEAPAAEAAEGKKAS